MGHPGRGRRFPLTGPSGRAALTPGGDVGRCGPDASTGREPMIERLFGGKPTDPAIAERIPPGQYKTDKFPVLHYGSVPHTDLATWDFRVFGAVDSPFTPDLGRVQGAAAQAGRDGHPLRHPLDEARHGLGGRADPGDPGARPASGRRRPTSWPTPSRATPPTCRCRARRRRRPPGRHVRRQAARAGARLAAPAVRPEALLLEERQVDPRPRVPRPRHPRLLGALRLQQRRRPVEGRALLRVAQPARRPRGRQPGVTRPSP